MAIERVVSKYTGVYTDQQYIGRDGEIVVDLSTLQVYVHDGFTPGGIPITGGSGNGIPGGANSTIQWNNSGLFGGNYLLRWDGSTFYTPSANISNSVIAGNLFTDNIFYANGVPWSSGGTGDYSNANVAAYLASNSAVTINTTGSVALSGPDVSLGQTSNLRIFGGNSGQVLQALGNGALAWTSVSGVGAANIINLGTPADGNLTGNSVAITSWTPNTYVTDSVDDLNEVIFNVARGTYLGQLDFTANVTSGPSPLTVLFTSTFVGNVNQYSWNFGDGGTSTVGPSVTHTYSSVSGGVFTVSLTATNTGAVPGSQGSSDTRVRNNYISLATPLPISSFNTNPTSLDSTDIVTLTNQSQYATSYSLNWGDGNIVDPGNAWTTTTHQYVAPANVDSIYSIVLTATNQTAGPTPPYNVNSPATNVRVYTQQSPAATANTAVILNNSTVSFRNDTLGQPGSTTQFGSQQYWVYQWGDGTANSVINIIAGVPGNPGAGNVTHAYSLTPAQQAAGTVVNYDATLWLYTGYSTSPFRSSNVSVSVEPRVAANFVGQANVVSDRTGDTALVGYIYTDYLGRDRSLFEFQNLTSPTPPYPGNSFSWNWGDGTFSNVTSGANVTHAWTTLGSKTVALTAQGNLATIAQSNTTTRTNYVTISANPSAPTDLSAYSLTMASSSQGVLPRLVSGAVDQTGGSAPAAGTSVIRYATVSPVISATINNANTATAGTLSASISGTTTGSVTFTPTGNAVGTYSALVVSRDQDAHTAINPSVYPSYFYKVFNASISQPLASLGIGYNTYRLNHSVSGSTTAAGFVRDNLTAIPSLSTATVAVVEVSPGTLRYISGVPYYNTGASVNINNLSVANLTGQAYTDITTPLTINSGTNYEGTSGAVINTQTKTYAQISGVPSMLVAGIPIANVGIGANYTFADLSVNINAASTKAVASLGVSVTNLNGSSAVVQTPTRIQIYAGAVTGVNENAVPVSDSLGTIFTDDGVRITGFSASANTPAFSGSTNYYTNNAWSGAVAVAGTAESVVRWGAISHFAVDLSSGYLPVGPDLSAGRTGLQYFTFAFRRATVANFDIILSGRVSGVWIAAPGTQIDTTSGLNGWLNCNAQYAGSGVPGSGPGGNGSDGCAVTGADIIPLNTLISNQRYTQTLGSENSSNSTGNNILVRIALASGQSISDVQIGVAT